MDDTTSSSSYALETFLGVIFLIAVLGLVVFLVRRILNTGRVTVGEEVRVTGDPATAEGRVAGVLGSFRKSDCVQVAPMHYALILVRLPTWAVLAPLIALIVPRDRVRLDVVLSYHDGAVWARLSGITEKDVLGQVRQALAGSV